LFDVIPPAEVVEKGQSGRRFAFGWQYVRIDPFANNRPGGKPAGRQTQPCRAELLVRLRAQLPDLYPAIALVDIALMNWASLE
jgi:hypothetical protein